MVTSPEWLRKPGAQFVGRAELLKVKHRDCGVAEDSLRGFSGSVNHPHPSFTAVGVIEYPASFNPRLISLTTTSSGSSRRSPGIHSVMLSTTAITSSAVRVGAAEGCRIMQVRRSITR